MKRYMLLLFCLVPALYAAAQDNGDTLVLFEKKQTVYLLGDSINIRKTPGTDGAVMTRLPIGSPLVILDKSEVASRIGGLLMPWYLVSFNGSEQGYVWGGKIALNSFRSNKDPDIVFHFGISHHSGDIATFQIRVEKDHKELQRLRFKGLGTEYKRHTCINISNKGLNGVDDILQVDAYGEFCGDMAGSIVFFWTGTELLPAGRLYDLFDGPYFDREFFVYPSDMDGEKETVIYREQSGEIITDEEGYGNWSRYNVVYEKNSSRRLYWNGRELVPQK